MSLRKYNYRKRRRAQAFPEEDDVQGNSSEYQTAQNPSRLVDGVHEQAMNEDIENEGEVNDDMSSDRAMKEQAVWEAFREEHYEVLEQLPLSLHRAYTLVNELDEQVNTYNNKILQQVKNYIAMRQSLSKLASHTTEVPMVVDEESVQNPTSTGEDTAIPEPSRAKSSPLPSPTKPPKFRSRASMNGSAALVSPSRPPHETSKPTSPPPPPPPETTRSVLANIARTSEEVTRAANEKLNVTRFACDLIDRYIRDMDRAIKEQETSLSLGLRPGTHPATIVLPEVVLPKTARAARVQDTPLSDQPESPEADRAEPESEADAAPATDGTAEMTGDAAGMSAQSKKKSRKSHGWSKKKPDHKEKEKTEPPVVGEEENAPPQPEPERNATKLTVTLPPLASLQQPSLLEPVDPNEPTYCYCNRISFGEMVACDGCDGWFHFECIDEKTIPKGKWYCRDCAPTKGQGRPRAKHGRRKR